MDLSPPRRYLGTYPGVAICFFGAILLTEVITDETLSVIAIFEIYSHPTLGVSLTLLPTLWFTRRYAEKCLRDNEKLLRVSFKYCLITNLVVWTAFSLVFVFGPLSSRLGFVMSFVLFITFLIISTFTIGLLVC